jgi:hypothetical protein
MEPLVNAKDLELFWVQPSVTRHYFILRSGETIFTRLNFQSEFDALAEAPSINDAWTINRVGFFSSHIIVHRVGSNIDRVTSSPSWTGAESQIQFSSGEVYFWKVANFWATRHTISNGD